MTRPYFLFCLCIFLWTDKVASQAVDSLSHFKLNGYVDAYYAYYTDSVVQSQFQQFPSVSPRSEQFGLNIALLSLQYDATKFRGAVSLQYGDIPKSAWSPSFNNILEAHAGILLAKNIWLDAGFFRTHFGTEGLFPRENLVSSVSINTYYEPYYEAGVRLNFVPTSTLSISLYGLNGYNLYEDNNKKKSIGMLITKGIGDNGNIGYSNYIGDDSPGGDPVSHLRFHQNVFFNNQFGKIKIQLGADYCMQAHSDIEDSDKSGNMYSGVFSLKWQIAEHFAIAGRGEYFNDPNGYMSTLFADKENKLTGYKLWGVTLDLEYSPTPNTYIRLEGRKLQFDENQEIFYWEGKNRADRYEWMIHTGVSF